MDTTILGKHMIHQIQVRCPWSHMQLLTTTFRSGDQIPKRRCKRYHHDTVHIFPLSQEWVVVVASNLNMYVLIRNIIADDNISGSSTATCFVGNRIESLTCFHWPTDAFINIHLQDMVSSSFRDTGM